MNSSYIKIFTLSGMFSLIILAICYPGFMSTDSIMMLEEARSSVRGGIYPAVPVYILRLFDITGDGPAVMITLQNFIIIFSLMLILGILGSNVIHSTLTLLAFLSMPTVIGCMLVLWKDVTMTSLVMLSITLIFWASQTSKINNLYVVAKWCSIILLIIGTLVRFNAITTTVIILVYWLTVFFKQNNWKIKGGVFFVILISMMTSNKVFNNYGFPDLRKLEPNNVIYGVMANDLVGISGWSRVSLVPFDSEMSQVSAKIPIENIDKIYDSLGVSAMNCKNNILGNIVKVYPEQYKNEDILRAWLNAVTHYPLAYLRYRWDIFTEIIGAKNHPTFEPTHYNRIDENTFGIEFNDRKITDVTLSYIKKTSNIFYGKPWFIILLSFLSVIAIMRDKFIDADIKYLSLYLFAGSVLYIAPFMFIPSAGEVRYSFPSVVMSFSSLCVYIICRINPRKQRLMMA